MTSSVHLVINFVYLLNFVVSKKLRANWAPPIPEPRSRIALRSFQPQAISSRLLRRLFSSHVARYKYNIPRPISHEPKQARFKYISRSKIGGKVTGTKWPYSVSRARSGNGRSSACTHALALLAWQALRRRTRRTRSMLADWFAW